MFRFTRPDEMAAQVIKGLLKEVPNLDVTRIDDVIVGNATPEAEQGLNIGRMISLLALDTDKVPGVTVNRYCSSGIQTIAMGAQQIHAGMADCIIAGGVETMSPIPFGGWRLTPNAKISKENPEWYWGMGLTAEAVAQQFKITREAQDEFAYHSQRKALEAIESGRFKSGIIPIDVEQVYLDEAGKRQVRNYIADTDEGVRKGTTVEGLSKLRPVFDAKGTVTAGNASQTSDGAAFVILMSEKMLKETGATPIARLASYGVVGVEPRIMGIGPVDAIPKAAEMAGLKVDDIELFELNEAFASQSLAVLQETGINPDIVNVNGGAIALGHPLGCTGAKLTVQIIEEMKLRNQKHGMVTMCVGTGQGAAGVIELL
jgi:acetyl-CoA acyltransferase